MLQPFHMNTRASERGITLVELMIVLTIIGLLVGGIMGGQQLIRASELRSVMKDIEDYKQAIASFENIYEGYPGDLYNADTFWAATQSGDGNGRIEWSNSEPTSVNESLNAWEQLQLAELIPGSFNGVDTHANQAFPGENVPESEIGGGYTIHYSTISGTVDRSRSKTDHFFRLGGYTAGNMTTGALLMPVDAYQIDNKMDDGRPESGSVWGLGPGCGRDEDGNATTAPTYNVPDETPNCTMDFSF